MHRSPNKHIIKCLPNLTNGDENHLCGVSLRESRKIPEAHWHATWGWYPKLGLAEKLARVSESESITDL